MTIDSKNLPRRKDLLDIESLSREEIQFLLQTAKPFKELFTRSVKKVPPLKGKSVLNFFYEPSTRTRSSFEIAAKRLSADVTDFTVSQSSAVKGESVKDTVDTLQAMKVDYLICRHSKSGVPAAIARQTNASVINAGDGYHAHPTQALLDAYTLQEILPGFTGQKIVIVGDIAHSRVARSVSTCCHRLGMEVAYFGPGTLIPRGPHPFIRVLKSYDEVFDWAPDVIYLLRLQLERQKANFFPTMHEYHQIFGLSKERFRHVADRGIHVMHPGPVNRGVEISNEVMDYERCWINRQVENGIAMRMAILYWLQPEVSARAEEVEGESW